MKDQHFGGVAGMDEDPSRKHMSHKDRFSEVIQQSRQKKLEAKRKKEEMDATVKEIDTKLSLFQSFFLDYHMSTADKDALEVSLLCIFFFFE